MNGYDDDNDGGIAQAAAAACPITGRECIGLPSMSCFTRIQPHGPSLGCREDALARYATAKEQFIDYSSDKAPDGRDIADYNRNVVRPHYAAQAEYSDRTRSRK